MSKTIEQLREEFARLKRNAGQSATSEEWMAAVRTLLTEKGIASPTPENWVDAAMATRTTCCSCCGSGKYYGRGYVENGVFRGFTGPCFRCQGKGTQGQDDYRRNWGHDQHIKVI